MTSTTNPLGVTASLNEGVVVPHALFNALELYFDANANVSDECGHFLEQLTALRVAQLPEPVAPESLLSEAKKKLDGLRRRKDTAHWRWGELVMRGAAKDTVDEAYRDIEEADTQIKQLLQVIKVQEQINQVSDPQ